MKTIEEIFAQSEKALVRLCIEAQNNGHAFEESAPFIADILASKGLEASPKAHWNKGLYVAKNGYAKSGNSSAADKNPLSAEDMMRIQSAAIALYGKPLVGPADIPFVSRREFETIYQALVGLEKQGIIEFAGKALANIELAEKAAKIEAAMELLKSEGIEIETRKAATWAYGYDD